MTVLLTERSLLAALTLLTLCIAQALSPAMVQAGSYFQLQAAPFNPAFESFLRESASRDRQTANSSGHSPGHIPPPVNLSQLNKGPLSSQETAGAYPSKYDLRTLQRVPPVRDQGACGSCWAFGTLASLESHLLSSGQQWDFSEADMNQNHGFDDRVCDGGNYFMAMAHLARWSGPFAEATYPYPYARSPVCRTTTAPIVKKHLQEALFLPERAEPLNNNYIKWAIMNYGAVSISYHEDEIYFNGVDSYYCTESWRIRKYPMRVITPSSYLVRCQ